MSTAEVLKPEILKPVTSSMFSHAGYDGSTWTLFATYRSTGETRGYKNVDPELADEVLGAKSIGTAFNQLIKGKFEHDIMPAAPGTVIEGKKKPSVSDEACLSAEDINAVLGTSIETSQDEIKPISGSLSAMKKQAVIIPAPELAADPEPIPDLDAASAIALPQTKAPEIESVVEQGRKLATEAQSLKITDAVTYQLAADLLKNLQDAKDRAFRFLDPIRDAIYKAYQVAQKKQKEALDPLDTAMTAVRRGMAAWSQEQERIRLERQAELTRQAEEEARQRQREASEQLTLAEVQDAIESGDTERAEELIAAPIEVPAEYVAPVHVESTVPEVHGVHARKAWKIDTDSANMATFLQGVKDGKIEVDRAAQLVIFNFPALNKLARALEKTFSLPGLRAYNDGVVIRRR